MVQNFWMNGFLFLTFLFWERLMMRSRLRFGMFAAALIGLSGLNASAGDLGLVVNGDMEEESRFSPHGTPGVDHPNGYADGWHHSANSAWSNGTTDPVTSGVHSLWIPDDRFGDHDEMRSFATAIPGVGAAGRTLDVSWNWNWDITSDPADVFTATIRISDTDPAGGLDLGGSITDHVFLTGTGNSGGFVPFTTSIPLSPTDAAFDIIFRTRDNNGDSSETGTLFVDDVSAVIPEPASLLLLSISGLMIMGRRLRG